MLKVTFTQGGSDYGSFLAIETPTCAPRGDDEPLLVDDIEVARKLVADLQKGLAQWEKASA